MVKIKNKNGAYLCLAWASKDADKAFELTEELCAKVMLSVGIDNCIVEDISLKPNLTPAQENAYKGSPRDSIGENV